MVALVSNEAAQTQVVIEVADDGGGLNKAKILVYKANSGFMGSDCTSHSEIVAAHGDHKVGVWLVKTGQNLDEGALSRDILADKCVNFALFNNWNKFSK